MSPAGDLTQELEAEKRSAAERASELVEAGMSVGLGTGTTVAYLLPALAARRLDVVCVATSPATEVMAVQLGLRVLPGDSLHQLDIAIDGADQVSTERWLVKGGGGAHTREKIVAASADRFVVIVASDKLVERIHAPIPVELLAFGIEATLKTLGDCNLRNIPPSPDGGVIADWLGEVEDPEAVARWLDSVPGVIGHGLFPPSMVSVVIVGRGSEAEVFPHSALT